jgi:hypothetical protein
MPLFNLISLMVIFGALAIYNVVTME